MVKTHLEEAIAELEEARQFSETGTELMIYESIQDIKGVIDRLENINEESLIENND